MRKNFFLGRGENLTAPIESPQRPSPKTHPYTFDEAVQRLTPQLKKTRNDIQNLSQDLCPNDECVFKVILHPAYTARSYFPEVFLKLNNLKLVGSKTVLIKPEKDKRVRVSEKDTALNLYVSAKRSDIYELDKQLQSVSSNKIPEWSEDFIKIETISYFEEEERIKSLPKSSEEEITYELVVHMDEANLNNYVLKDFIKYIRSKNVIPDMSKIIFAQGLAFIPAKGKVSSAKIVEKHSFLRVLREMPKLRDFANKSLRSFTAAKTFPIRFPDSNALNENIKVAIFDGGLSSNSPLARWSTNNEDFKDMKTAVPYGIEHGEWVTSAFLFGPLEENQILPIPFAKVDHFRVVDEETDAMSDLPEVLKRIEKILIEKKHEFVNLSIGPFMSVDDDEVHVWTAKLDELLSDGKIFCSVAVGNTGHLDKLSRANRIQVPADAVNAVSVGACNKNLSKTWERSLYSSVGPGRSPGLIKPDLAAFGGSGDHPFYVVDHNLGNKSFPTQGTSFAAPYLLRKAVGIKAYFDHLSAMTIKCLLIHKAEKKKTKHQHAEYGWGKAPTDLEHIYTCPDDAVTVIYQGELKPSKYLQAKLPVIPTIKGPVKIKATFTYVSQPKANNSNNYTSNGLEIFFRPHAQKYTPNEVGKLPNQPDPDSFFGKKKEYKTESDSRRDSFKWETVLNAERRKDAADLYEPTFDIHYITRDGVTKSSDRKNLNYSLVITVTAPETPDLYNKTVRYYQNELEVFEPTIEIPVENQT